MLLFLFSLLCFITFLSSLIACCIGDPNDDICGICIITSFFGTMTIASIFLMYKYTMVYTPNVEVFVDNQFIFKGSSEYVNTSTSGNKTKIKIRRQGLFSAGTFYETVSDNVVVRTTKDKNKWIWVGDCEKC